MTKKLLKLQISEEEEKSENIDFSTWKVEEAEIPAMMPALFSLAMSWEMILMSSHIFQQGFELYITIIVSNDLNVMKNFDNEMNVLTMVCNYLNVIT